MSIEIHTEDGPMFRSVVHECCVVAEAVRQLYEHMCEHVGTEGAPHTDREFVEMLLHVLAADRAPAAGGGTDG